MRWFSNIWIVLKSCLWVYMEQEVHMRFISIILVCLLLVSCTAPTETYKFATGSIGGVYYPLGSGISEILSDNIDGVLINAYTGNASVSNSKLIQEGSIDMALIQSNVASWSEEGTGTFDAPLSDIRGVASLYSEVIQIIVREDAEIYEMEDLIHKRVSMGKVDSGNYFDAVNLLDAHEIEIEALDVSYLSFAEAFDKMVEGELDAVFVTSGIPTSSIMLMSSKVNINLLSIKNDILSEMIDQYPFYTREIIPAGTYIGQNEDRITLSTRALWLCHKDLDEEFVYRMLEVYYDNLDDVMSIHPSLSPESIDTALKGMSIPLHPGAERYYKELNINVED